jgi:hypothetical protein
VVEIKINRDSKIARFLIPSFDELTIFCMSYTLIFLLIIDKEFQNDFTSFFLTGKGQILLFFMIIGIIFSIYHVFSSRKKGTLAKTFMIAFVIAFNLMAGIFCLIQFVIEPMIINPGKSFPIFSLENFDLKDMILPILNFLYSFYLMILWDQNVLDIRDDDTPRSLALFSIILLSIVLIVCEFIFHMYWVISFSVVVLWIDFISHFILEVGKRYQRNYKKQEK